MSGIKLTFTNNSNIPADQEVYVGFYTNDTTGFDIVNLKSGGPAITWIYNNAASNPGGNWYTLDDLEDGVEINKFLAGRIYVCYNAKGQGGWTLNPDNPAAEPAQTLTLGDNVNSNFWLRYDKIELTVTPSPYDVADLTTIDFWAIPISLKATMNGVEPNGGGVYEADGLLGHTSAQDIYNDLDPLTTPPVSGITPQRGQPYPALVPGAFNGDDPPNTYPDPTPNVFARIIGPPAYATIFPLGFPITPYDTLEPYLQYLADTFGPGTEKNKVIEGLGDGVIATIAGNFAGDDNNDAGAYKYSATIDASLKITLTPEKGASPDCKTIGITKEDLLNPSGIYGANPNCTIGGNAHTGIPNDINGWAIGDFTGGLNIGAVGSQTKDAEAVVGAMDSQDWFGLNPVKMFANLQPAEPSPGIRYYNQWASTLTPLSNAYNFAFSDRLTFPGSHVQVSLDQTYVNELDVILDDATIVMS